MSPDTLAHSAIPITPNVFPAVTAAEEAPRVVEEQPLAEEVPQLVDQAQLPVLLPALLLLLPLVTSGFVL